MMVPEPPLVQWFSENFLPILAVLLLIALCQQVWICFEKPRKGLKALLPRIAAFVLLDTILVAYPLRMVWEGESPVEGLKSGVPLVLRVPAPPEVMLCDTTMYYNFPNAKSTTSCDFYILESSDELLRGFH